MAVGPDIMFIDPLMWISKHYGRGTDVFGVGHLMLLLFFGMRAAHNHASPCPKNTHDRSEEFNAISLNRSLLRHVLKLEPAQALAHPTTPVHTRWRGCPPHVLHLLMHQVRGQRG